MIARRKPLKRSSKPLKRTPLARVSKKRAKEMRTYSKLRKEFLAVHQLCGVWLKENNWVQIDSSDLYVWQRGEETISRNVWAMLDFSGAKRSCDIHHTAKRTGPNYLDTSTWLAVSREAHERIHANPSWAREMGFLK
jgi:hypothetical protein